MIVDGMSLNDAPEYRVHPIDSTAHAIVLAGSEERVVAWSFDLRNAQEIARALNEAKGL